MKIAIHPAPGSYSDRWVKYCIENQISYKLVNCYDSGIMNQLDGCEGLMWHWDLNDYKASLFARQLTISLEKKGIRVFPDVNTAWHYDDKVGQKYLLEAIGAPLVKTYVFYIEKDALDWIDNTTFPKVFKLRRGAGSLNVELVRSKIIAKRIVKKAFSTGFSHHNGLSNLKQKIWVMNRDKNLPAFKGILKGILRLAFQTDVKRNSQNEKGYVYFQDFIQGNDYDTRLVVVGNRCFGIRRYCRKGDFRASGSGILKYEPELFDKKCIKIAFEVARKLGSQSVAFDFIKDGQEYKIVEISYCYKMGKAYDDCPGYWNDKLEWQEEVVNPQVFMIEDFINLKSISF